MNADAAADEGVVYTAGISSVVLDGDDAVGHVLLLDVDDSDELTVLQAASSMDGVTAVFQSSPGSFHIWNLSVRPFETAILDGLSWRISDPQHVAQSRRRGYYVLRATAKVREGGDGETPTCYKEAPQLRAVYDSRNGETPAQSLPHLLRLRAVIEEQQSGQSLPDLEAVETVGCHNGLAVDRYMTLDDDAKERVREA